MKTYLETAYKDHYYGVGWYCHLDKKALNYRSNFWIPWY